LPETDVGGFVSYKECQANVAHMRDMLDNIEESVGRNRQTNDKIVHILQGNGEGGLIWKVNSMMQRNQWIDKGFGIIISIISTLITLYLTGALHI